MTDTTLLRNLMEESGFKIYFIAKKCGMSYPSLLSRLNGEHEFKVNEVRALKEILNLTDEDVAKIFYAE